MSRGSKDHQKYVVSDGTTHGLGTAVSQGSWPVTTSSSPHPVPLLWSDLDCTEPSLRLQTLASLNAFSLNTPRLDKSSLLHYLVKSKSTFENVSTLNSVALGQILVSAGLLQGRRESYTVGISYSSPASLVVWSPVTLNR